MTVLSRVCSGLWRLGLRLHHVRHWPADGAGTGGDHHPLPRVGGESQAAAVQRHRHLFQGAGPRTDPHPGHPAPLKSVHFRRGTSKLSKVIHLHFSFFLSRRILYKACQKTLKCRTEKASEKTFQSIKFQSQERNYWTFGQFSEGFSGKSILRTRKPSNVLWQTSFSPI